MKTTDNNNHLTTIDSSPGAFLGTAGRLVGRGLVLGPCLGEQHPPELGLRWQIHHWGECAGGLPGGCACWPPVRGLVAGLPLCVLGCHQRGTGNPRSVATVPAWLGHPRAKPPQGRTGLAPGLAVLCVAASSPAGLSPLPPCPRRAARGEQWQQPVGHGYPRPRQLWKGFVVEGKNPAVLEGSAMRAKRFAVPQQPESGAGRREGAAPGAGTGGCCAGTLVLSPTLRRVLGVAEIQGSAYLCPLLFWYLFSPSACGRAPG